MIKETNPESCPICGRSSQKLPVEHGKDYTMYRCSYCGGDFARTALSVDYHDEYRRDKGSREGYKFRAILETEQQFKDFKLFVCFKRALEFLKASSAKGKLLDVGCGVGVFPKLAEELGLEVYALDPAGYAIRYARENFGLKNTVAGTIDDIPPTWRTFDCITAFEVLEHLEQPRDLVKKIYRLLVPGGYFMMSVPNRDRLAAKFRRRDSWDYPPNHLTRWSKDTLNLFLNDLGFLNVVIQIDGIHRLVLASLLLPNKLNLKIMRIKMDALTAPGPAKGGFFLYSPVWKFVQRGGNAFASLLQIILGSLYGQYLIALGQKPPREF